MDSKTLNLAYNAICLDSVVVGVDSYLLNHPPSWSVVKLNDFEEHFKRALMSDWTSIPRHDIPAARIETIVDIHIKTAAVWITPAVAECISCTQTQAMT